MGGPNLHMPQSIFQHTMSNQGNSLYNESQWLGMPQVPAISMPWAIPPSQQPDFYNFTGRSLPTPSKIQEGAFKSFKRKFEPQLDFDEMRPTKQLITEEKMAQHFRGLHISPNTVNAHDAGPSTSGINNSQTLEDTSCIDLDFTSSLDSNESSSEPRLVISDELKRLQQEPILPSSLLTQSISKLERPSMALVLWQPLNRPLVPRDTPTPIPSEDDNNNSNNSMSTSTTNNNNSNNNSEGLPDLNQMMEVNINNLPLEPMDL